MPLSPEFTPPNLPVPVGWTVEHRDHLTYVSTPAPFPYTVTVDWKHRKAHPGWGTTYGRDIHGVWRGPRAGGDYTGRGWQARLWADVIKFLEAL